MIRANVHFKEWQSVWQRFGIPSLLLAVGLAVGSFGGKQYGVADLKARIKATKSPAEFQRLIDARKADK